MTRYCILIFSVFLLLFITACSKDDDDFSDNDELFRIGQSTFTVKGDINEKYTGGAILHYHDFTKEFALTMHNHSPQTFALHIIDYDDNLGIPDPGEYIIGQQPTYEESTGDFTAEFSQFVDNTYMGESHTYTTHHGGSGILKIYSSSEVQVKGSFEFTAYKYVLDENGQIVPGEIGEKIEVAGDFTAEID